MGTKRYDNGMCYETVCDGWPHGKTGRDDNNGMQYETPCDGSREGCSVRGPALEYEVLRFSVLSSDPLCSSTGIIMMRYDNEPNQIFTVNL